MCGISGGLFLSRSKDNDILIKLITDSQKRRGPDHQSIVSKYQRNHQILLAHNRLSIIDLSPASHQPFWDSEKKYCITYNGEIYNFLEIRKKLESLGYRFKTKGDTEVVLLAYKEWKEECIQLFNGFFAFAIYDVQKEVLFLARDRFGIKPLFYYENEKKFVFASTTNVISKYFSPTPNLRYLSRGEKIGIYENGTEETAYKNLFLLPSSSYMSIHIDGEKIVKKVKKYYDFHKAVSEKEKEISLLTKNEIFENLYNIFYESIKYRARADVDVGVTLSGGLDSASIAAILGEFSKSITCFSYGSPEKSRSEGAIIDKFSYEKGLEVVYLEKDLRYLMSVFDDVLDVQDAPFGGMSVLMQYCIYEEARSRGVKVLLGGQGGDEAFMGYRKYLFNYLKNMKNKKVDFCFLMYLLPTFLSEFNNIPLYLQRNRQYAGELKNKLFVHSESLEDQSYYNFNDIKKRQEEDILKYSLPTLLRYEDRNSSGNGVESRLPFMDYRLLELGVALPENLKLHKGYGKWCLREIIKDKLPDFIRLARYKKGFEDYQYQDFIDKGLGSFLRQKIDFKKCNDFLNVKIDKDYFSNEKMKKDKRTAFAQITSLIWMQNNVL